jgi:hypothetical protein
MAVFVPGMKCTLCGLPMSAGDETVLFPPFVANRHDPLFKFSDAAVHALCLERDPLGSLASELRSAASRNADVSRRRCEACGELVSSPDDYVGFGLLTSNPASVLFPFNFVHLHRTHVGRWSRFQEFSRAIAALQESEGWEGPRLVVSRRPHPDIRWEQAAA